MDANINKILKAACQRSRKKGVLSTDDVHFTMEDISQFIKDRRKKKEEVVKDVLNTSHSQSHAVVAHAKKRVLKAASLNDILGIASHSADPGLNAKKSSSIPQKWKLYYDKLMKLKDRLRHQTDANDDLEIGADPKEVLREIDAAVNRMFEGEYGICEITHRPIPLERLASIPYTRYSLEGQKALEMEKQKQDFMQRSSSSNWHMSLIDDEEDMVDEDGSDGKGE